MNRGQPLQRKTPLSPGSKPLTARKALGEGKPRKPLNPGKGLQSGGSRLRRTPMERTQPLAPSSPPEPGAATIRPRKPRKAPTASETFSPAVRAAIWRRCGGSCEACGLPLPETGWHAHHRQGRRGGDHSAANGVALHPNCHVNAPEAVHQRPAWARERGLIVRAGHVAADEPLLLPGGLRVLLHPVEARYLDEAA